MPEKSVKVHENDRPWLTKQLKSLIVRRQKALSSNNEVLFKILRNKVNRERNVAVKSIMRKKLKTFATLNLATGEETETTL